MARSTRVLPLLLLAVAGCDDSTTAPASPGPELTSVAPQVVCAEAPITTIDLTGDHLGPGPSDGVGAPTLPALTLGRTGGLDGAAVAGLPVRIPADHVRWSSTQQVSFDVTADLGLAEGVHGLTVSNPDGRAATLAHALAVLPAPTVQEVAPAGVTTQAAATVTLAGRAFLRVDGAMPTVTVTPAAGAPITVAPTMLLGCAEVASSVRPGLELCTGLALSFAAGELPAGELALSVTDPAPAACPSTAPASLVVRPPPDVTGVLPATICQGGGALVVSGSAFQDGATVRLDGIAAAHVSFGGATQLTATFAAGVAVGGPHDLAVENPDGGADTLPDAVTAVAGPAVESVEPATFPAGTATELTATTTTIVPPLVQVLVTPSGGGATIDVSATSHLDPAEPTHVDIALPGGLPAGTYDLTIEDSSGCPAIRPMAVQVVGALAP